MIKIIEEPDQYPHAQQRHHERTAPQRNIAGEEANPNSEKATPQHQPGVPTPISNAAELPTEIPRRLFVQLMKPFHSPRPSTIPLSADPKVGTCVSLIWGRGSLSCDCGKFLHHFASLQPRSQVASVIEQMVFILSFRTPGRGIRKLWKVLQSQFPTRSSGNVAEYQESCSRLPAAVKKSLRNHRRSGRISVASCATFARG